jgi:serine/threonine-protein kinase
MEMPMLKSVFGEALNRAPGLDRAAYLDAACQGDADLRAQVREPLRDRARLGGFLASDPDLTTGATDETVPYNPAAPAEPAVLPEPFGGISPPGRHDTEIDLGAGPPPSGSSPPRPGPDDRPGRYQLLGEIARGGMGAVFRARDPDLGRDIAVKVLLDEHRDDPRLVRRFVEEARIGGQLEHPGIQPIYGLGTLADRRPFFAMTLVRGRTLSELLAGRPDPAADRSRFLAIFEAVCRAVAFAHAQGVIHRDLKPANIMVGSFGEVQVMDWGLAKFLPRRWDERGEAEPADTAVADTLTGPKVDLSRADRIMGTPSYMAPEQAGAGAGRVDERSDVFALGSILSEILTGQPAFAGHDTREILRPLVRGDLADAFDRLDSCGSDPDLVALARRCLAAEPSERPRDAREVATAVTTYLATVQERLRAAELARVEAQAREVE